MRVQIWSLLVVLMFAAGCAVPKGIDVIDPENMEYSMDASDQAQVPPSDTVEPSFKFEPLSWESAKAANYKWSNYVFNLIDKEEFNNFDRATDATTFCPKYDQLSRLQKINFWGALISGMTKFESSYKATARMVEVGLGKDPFTGRQIASEGLLQLSYADAKYRSYCKMSWAADKNKADTDPTKTIFDPYVNLQCGVKILGRQIYEKGKVAITSGAYWSVIKPDHKNEKLSEITAITKQISFCN